MADDPDPDLDRAFDFILRADMAGTGRAPFRWGTAVLMPECPLRHDSNYLLVEGGAADADAAALAAEADRILGGAGLRHRSVMFRDAAAGERRAPGFEALGWRAFRGLVMAQRRDPDRVVDLTPARETDAASLRAAREAEILRYPWGSPQTARDLLGARALIPVPARPFAVFADGTPVSWGEMYLEGAVAQVEAVATEEAFRGRGYASAVVLRAAAAAREAGANFVFLCCDADDWPKDLYRRLGFDEIGRYVRFSRVP